MKPALPVGRNGAATVPIAEDEGARPARGRGVRVAVLAERFGPYLVASLLLLAGYLHFLPGVRHDGSADAYRFYSFPAFRYSDTIWIYLRDNLRTHPIPYVDYPLEYPVLTGLLSYAISFAPGLAAYYAILYLVMAACVLGTIAALQGLPGATPWLFAAAPAIYLYPGSQLDPAAILALAVGLRLWRRGRDRWATVALTAGVWFKLFPIAFLLALWLVRRRERRHRQLAESVALFAVLSLAINLPFALANLANWARFYVWNRERIADSGFWVLWPGLSTPTATALSGLAVALGWLVIAWLGLRSPRLGLVPLGSLFLLWWLLANKTFTVHLMLWVVFVAALLRLPLPLWVALAFVDWTNHQAIRLISLSGIVAGYNNPGLEDAARRELLNPTHVLRSLLLLVACGWVLVRAGVLPDPRRRWGAAVAAMPEAADRDAFGT